MLRTLHQHDLSIVTVKTVAATN